MTDYSTNASLPSDTYSAHPCDDGRWAVLNDRTGVIRCEYVNHDDAEEHAGQLNDDADPVE
jgi:hypothetical protein